MSASPSVAPAPPRWWQRPRFWLAVLVVGFFAVSSWAGFAAYSNFQFANNTDAGIVTQAVASTTFGRHPVFFESYDCMAKARCSFLLVHPGLVLYGAVPFFALWPSTITLFLLRSGLVALSAVPLYWLTRQVTGSAAKALLAAGLFLVWAPSFLGDAFSLHLETILPLELFTLAALWQAGRYRLGLAVAAVSFVTIEVAPIFTFLVGAFFLAPLAWAAARRLWPRWHGEGSVGVRLKSWFSRLRETLRQGFRRTDVRYALVLMGASVGAYIVLYTFMNVWGAAALGVMTPPVGPGVSGVFANNSSPAAVSIGILLTSPQTIYTAEFWLVLYATLAFIPLLSPRALILSVPWIGWTFLTNSSRFTTIGHQYTMVAAGPLFIGLAYGLQLIPPRAARSMGTIATRPDASPASHDLTRPTLGRARRRAVRAMVVGLFGAVIVANLLFVPVNPLLPDLGVNPGIPFENEYFDHTLAWNPSIDSVQAMVATIPYSATVAAPSSFFPLVATHPHAYGLVQPKNLITGNLPFNVSAGPQFVLITPSTLSILGPSFRANLSDPSIYGMRGYVSDANLGPLLLYEMNYTSPAQRFGPSLGTVNTTWAAGDGLEAGPVGDLIPNATSPTSASIVNSPATNRTGLLASTPSTLLAPGSYTLEVVVAAGPQPGFPPPHRSIFGVVAEGFGGTLVDVSYNLSAFENGNWTALSWNITTADPLPNLVVDVDLQTTRASVAVALVRLVPDASSG